LCYGADPNKAKRNGVTLLYITCQEGHLEVAKLLLDFGANVHRVYTEKNETPLYVACEMGHVEVAKFLLENGADKKIVDRNGLTPEDIARRNGHRDVVDLLVRQ
jgi:ankyrin repeat protein